MKKSFIIYSDFKSTLDKLPDEDAGKLFKMIVDFSNGIETVPESLILDVVFTPIKQQMIRDIEKYENEVKKRKEAGSLGGKAKAKKVASARSAKQVLPSAKQSVANLADNVTVNDTVNVNDTNKKSKPKKSSSINYKEIVEREKFFKDSAVKELFLEFIDSRVQKKKNPTERAVSLLFESLQKLSKGKKNVAEQILKDAIAGGWTGLHLTKESELLLSKLINKEYIPNKMEEWK